MNQETQHIYDNMLSEFRSAAAKGEQSYDLPPSPGDSRWGLSLIFRLQYSETPLIEHLNKTVEELTTIVGGDHLVYQTETFHTTVRSLEPFQAISHNDEKIDIYQEILENLVSSLQPLTIHYTGLTAAKATIMVRGIPLDDQLQVLRKQFTLALQKRNLHYGPEESSLRTTAHTSLVVLTTMIPNMSQLLTYIDQHRTTEYGIAHIHKLELVRYSRLISHVFIHTLANIELPFVD